MCLTLRQPIECQDRLPAHRRLGRAVAPIRVLQQPSLSQANGRVRLVPELHGVDERSADATRAASGTWVIVRARQTRWT